LLSYGTLHDIERETSDAIVRAESASTECDRDRLLAEAERWKKLRDAARRLAAEARNKTAGVDPSNSQPEDAPLEFSRPVRSKVAGSSPVSRAIRFKR
jgi:hypothetical protein